MVVFRATRPAVQQPASPALAVASAAAASASALVIRLPLGERTFAVDAAPHRDADARWRMTLDGAVLTRVR